MENHTQSSSQVAVICDLRLFLSDPPCSPRCPMERSRWHILSPWTLRSGPSTHLLHAGSPLGYTWSPFSTNKRRGLHSDMSRMDLDLDSDLNTRDLVLDSDSRFSDLPTLPLFARYLSNHVSECNTLLATTVRTSADSASEYPGSGGDRSLDQTLSKHLF